MKENIRFTVIGRRDGLPDYVQAEMDENIRVSSSNTGTFAAGKPIIDLLMGRVSLG